MPLDEILFEGFLQKRKDTLKLKWVTYWFRLQNTTLFFYTQKNGNASHLRGYYYIFTVQSVREVQSVGSKRFMFELIMTNGKRKVLAAETAALRKEWVGHLWQAMQLSTSAVSEHKSKHLQVCEQQERHSSRPVSSDVDSIMESLPVRPLSAPPPTNYIHHESPTILVNPSEELYDVPSQNPRPACNYQQHNSDNLNSDQWSSAVNNMGAKEGDYDVLPIRNKMCTINSSPQMGEGVYDVPVSWRASNHQNPTENVYDVPSSILRQTPDHTQVAEEQPEEGAYWTIEYADQTDDSSGPESSSNQL
ncbi:uncharacterized protein LOC128379249 [Scomber japonicus]|uniref:uncharacterized protein LOC128379249 n=1 Tax=Scomber japonicus TaxID=13676 RepID=UPI002305A844|nr:uncharacterized protein LOC128379249 [Scomber japonicus]